MYAGAWITGGVNICRLGLVLIVVCMAQNISTVLYSDASTT